MCYAPAPAGRPRLVRWVLRATLVLCEMSTLVPPPPPSSLLRRVRWLAWLILAMCITWNNLFHLLTGAGSYTVDFSTISRASFVCSTVLTAVQPMVIMLNNLFNFTRIAAPMAGLLLPPARFHAWYLVAATCMIGTHAAKHVRSHPHDSTVMPRNKNLSFQRSILR